MHIHPDACPKKLTHQTPVRFFSESKEQKRFVRILILVKSSDSFASQDIYLPTSIPLVNLENISMQQIMQADSFMPVVGREVNVKESGRAKRG